MGVKIISRTYNEIYNTDSTDWLIGNAGDWQKLRLKIESSIEFKATSGEPIQISENELILVNGKGWQDYGFDIGMNVTMSFNEILDEEQPNPGKTNHVLDFSVQNIYGEVMEVVASSQATQNELNQIVDEYGIIPSDRGSKRIRDVIIYSDQEPEGIKVRYGHITNENSSSQTMASVVDGSVSEFIRSGINLDEENVFKNMQPIGIQSGMSIRSMKVRKISAPVSQTSLQALYSLHSNQFRLQVQSIFGTIGTNVRYRSLGMHLHFPFTNHQDQETLDIPININPGTNGQLENGDSLSCFVNDVQGALAHTYKFDIKIIIGNTLSSIPNDTLSLVLLRYNDVTGNLVPSGEIELMKWSGVGNMSGQTLPFNEEFVLFGEENDYYSLSLKYEHEVLGTNDTRYVDITDVRGSVEVFPQAVGLEDYKKYLEVEIEFMINGVIFSSDDFDDTTVVPNVLFNQGSLTDNFIIDVYPEWNNPNTSIRNVLEQTERLGNTGWFNENFNQLDNDFKIESVTYIDENANKVKSLDYSQNITAIIEVSGIENFNVNTEFGFGLFWVPENDAEFKEKKTPLYQNLFLCNGSYTDGYKVGVTYGQDYIGAGLNGASITADNVKVIESNGNAIITVRFKPNANFTNTFESKQSSDRRYVLFVSVGEFKAQRNFSNRVSLIADFSSYQKSIVSSGAYDLIQNEFLEHPLESDVRGVGYYKGIVQDDILCRMPFQIKKDGTFFNSMTFGVEVVNVIEEKTLEIENTTLDLTSFSIDSQGIQQINVDTTRGYRLEEGNNKNWVKIKREPSLDTTESYGYVAFYAFKIRWEDWLQNDNALDDFFDSSLLNNGLSNDWVPYLKKAGWETNFFTVINSTKNNELTSFRNSFEFEFDDYDENVLIDTLVEYKNGNGDVINIGIDPQTGKPLGVILENEDTFIEISYIITDSGIWNFGEQYAVTTIEIDNGIGATEQRQLSSVWGSETDNP